MDSKSSSDSEKTNGNNNLTGLEASEEEFGQVIGDNDCNTLTTNVETAVEIHEPCSEAIFSQETPEVDEITKNVKVAISSDNSNKSSDVTHVTPPMELIVLETDSDSTSNKSSVVVISDSGDLSKADHPTKSVRRKSPVMSPVPCKKTCLEETRQSESSTNIDTASPTHCKITKTVTPIRNTPVAVRSSPRNSPKKNYNLLKPARRLKRSASADVDIDDGVKTLLSDKPSTSSPSSIKSLEGKNCKLSLRRKRALSVDVKQSREDVPVEIMSQDELCGYLGSQDTLSQIRNFDIDNRNISSGRKNPINPIAEEAHKDISDLRLEESQNLISADSQNIQLFLSPSLDTPNLLSTDVIENEPLLSQDLSDDPNTSDKVVLLSESNHVSLSNGIHKSTDQESTVSVDLDSPYNLEMPVNPHLKSKPYLSNGYSSSTPENAPFTQDALLKKTFHLSDSETDNTPPFSNFNKQPGNDSKMSISSKSNSSGTRNNSSISLNNGHSGGSHISNSPIPTFHIQMYGDENDEFLSMFIVKTTSEMGAQTLREYQRLSKRLSIDPYAGDVSKSTSPSSVTSGGLLQLPMHPRSSFMSTNSSSSTSSSRTSDGAFIIPQRPKRNLSFHTPTTVKGWQALKQSVTDIISNLTDIDPTGEGVRSPINGECRDQQMPSNDTDKPTTNSDSNVVKNITNDCHRTTPKSSKKKVQTRTKRVLSSKIKRSELSITSEEPQELSESISSPEMIPTDKCEQFQTPSRLKSNDESSSSPKSTPRGRKTKNGSVVLNLSTVKENPCSAKNQEQTYPRGTLVLAKWRDKKYYSGKVISSLDNNKYEIEFYDGQIKTLLDDFIIFGNMTELPLKGQSVYTKVDDVTYEPSLVLAIEKTETGKVLYKCTTDRDSMVAVAASDIYLTEDQAKSFHESNPPKSPHSAPNTPRRRINRDLDLNNIIHEPRSARIRDKGTPKGSPASPKAGTSSVRRGGGGPQRRLESESSEGGDSRASSAAPEDVDGVQPEMLTTPRRTKGITKVTYSQIKGSSKQKSGKDSKVKFETEEELTKTLGPIPTEGSTLFSGLHFLLTCIDIPMSIDTNRSNTVSNDNDSCMDSSGKEDEMLLARIPFTKKRLEEQLGKGGGKVYSRFEDIPKSKYSSTRLIVPRPCLTGKFIMCLAANIKALCHLWVIQSCKNKKLADYDSYTLPTGFSIERDRMISLHERSTSRPFKDKLILICSDNNNFTKFWDRVCSLAGGNTKIITENDMDLRNSIAIVTESNCPTKIRNKAEYENVSLVSTTWVVQCLIEGKLLSTSRNIRYKFDYIDN